MQSRQVFADYDGGPCSLAAWQKLSHCHHFAGILHHSGRPMARRHKPGFAEGFVQAHAGRKGQAPLILVVQGQVRVVERVNRADRPPSLLHQSDVGCLLVVASA